MANMDTNAKIYNLLELSHKSHQQALQQPLQLFSSVEQTESVSLWDFCPSDIELQGTHGFLSSTVRSEPPLLLVPPLFLFSPFFAPPLLNGMVAKTCPLVLVFTLVLIVALPPTSALSFAPSPVTDRPTKAISDKNVLVFVFAQIYFLCLYGLTYLLLAFCRRLSLSESFFDEG